MQKIIYISPQGDEIEITPYGPDLVFEQIKGISAIDTQLVISTPASLDGALYQTIMLNDREVTLDFHVHGYDRSEMYKNREYAIRLLSSSINKDGKQGELHYINDYGHWWIPAVIKQGPKETRNRTGRYLHMQVVFYCADPLWRLSDVDMQELAYLSGGFKFPFNIPAITEPEPGVKFGLRGYQAIAYNHGDALTPVQISITGPALQPRITNKTTGEFIAIHQAIEANGSLEINTEKGHRSVVIVAPTGERQSAMGMVTPESSFFQLLPGSNELEYTSGDDTTTAQVIIKSWSRLGGV